MCGARRLREKTEISACRYTGCLAWPVLDWADFPQFDGEGVVSNETEPERNRATSMAWYALSAKRWVAREFPYWNRTGGVDHVMFVVNDEASCWVPAELRSMTLLSHWGSTDLDHWCAPVCSLCSCARACCETWP